MSFTIRVRRRFASVLLLSKIWTAPTLRAMASIHVCLPAPSAPTKRTEKRFSVRRGHGESAANRGGLQPPKKRRAQTVRQNDKRIEQITKIKDQRLAADANAQRVADELVEWPRSRRRRLFAENENVGDEQSTKRSTTFRKLHFALDRLFNVCRWRVDGDGRLDELGERIGSVEIILKQIGERAKLNAAAFSQAIAIGARHERFFGHA